MFIGKNRKFLMLIALFALAIPVFAAGLNSGSAEINLTTKALVSGTELKAGSYTIQWQSEANATAITFTKNGQIAAKVLGKIETLEKKAEHDTYFSKKDASGNDVVKAILLHGKTVKIVFE